MKLFDFIGSAVCHQIAERSFILGGKQLPLCARCTGIYSGIFFTMLFFFLSKRLRGNQPYGTWGMVLGALAFLPISIDGAFSYLGFWESTQLSRVVTGSLAGASLAGFLLLGANFGITEKNDQPIFQSVKEQSILVGITLFWGLLLWCGIGNYYITSVIFSMGVILFWMNLFYLVIKNLAGTRKLHFWSFSLLGGVCMILAIGVLQL